jgi:acyl carrier protein
MDGCGGHAAAPIHSAVPPERKTRQMDIKETVEKFVVEELMVSPPGTSLDPDTSLVSSGVIDSLAILRLITFLEEKFGIAVEDEEVVPENFETINVIKAFVEDKL